MIESLITEEKMRNVDRDRLVEAYNILSELHEKWDDEDSGLFESLEMLEDVMDRLDELMDRVIMSEKWGKK
jgi:hypothetical protein